MSYSLATGVGLGILGTAEDRTFYVFWLITLCVVVVLGILIIRWVGMALWAALKLLANIIWTEHRVVGWLLTATVVLSTILGYISVGPGFLGLGSLGLITVFLLYCIRDDPYL